VHDDAVEDPGCLVDHDLVHDADAPAAAVVDRYALRERERGDWSAEVTHSAVGRPAPR
jgi:hypothetical protein